MRRCTTAETTGGRTLVLSSNLPFGVSIMIAGGRKGYSEGSSMRKWYSPPSNSVPGGPRIVQCHSYRMVSRLPTARAPVCGSTHEDIVLPVPEHEHSVLRMSWMEDSPREEPLHSPYMGR